MLSYQDTQNTLHVLTIDFTLQEYFFVMQVVLGERVELAYANTFDTGNFKRYVPSEDEEEYLLRLREVALLTLSQQSCAQLKDYLEQQYNSDVQEKAMTLKDFKFTGADAQRILNNLLKDRTTNLSESSVKDIISLLKMMYENGSLDSGDSFEHHFITIPKHFDCICPNCNHEIYLVEGVDNKCSHCSHVLKWADGRFYPQPQKL